MEIKIGDKVKITNKDDDRFGKIGEVIESASQSELATRGMVKIRIEGDQLARLGRAYRLTSIERA